RNARRCSKGERRTDGVPSFTQSRMGRLDDFTCHAPMSDVDLAVQSMLFDGRRRGLGDLTAPVLSGKIRCGGFHHAGFGIDGVGHCQEVVTLLLEPVCQEIFAACAFMAAISNASGMVSARDKNDQRLIRFPLLEVCDCRVAGQFDSLLSVIELLGSSWKSGEYQSRCTSNMT